MTDQKKDTTLIVKNIDPTVKRQFQSFCASRGITMKDGLIQAMQFVMRAESWTNSEKK